ncbi:hypothetical protein Pint_25864 [Pistacia integerrima]|uniref:Uncharacterized protein n=1 Tax=Pistacia integerrima TaxID=434235 RepID=A0ACC0YCW1_9ROSI|nr:hypothetical protein Pint_25864 [Pistacia integerrima]
MLNKVLNEFTHIVAVRTTGNVFCYDAIKELNIKTKNWKELLTDEPFTKEDLITIQVISCFEHMMFSFVDCMVVVLSGMNFMM